MRHDTIASRALLVAVVLTVVCLVWSTLLGAVLEVDAAGGASFQTIQSAIDAAIPGQDSVFVRCGTYGENISMRNGVSVRGEGADCTTIDGGQLDSVVSIVGVGSDTALEEFTITNGRSTLGGGIFIESSEVVITQNVITGNSAIVDGFFTGYGGGIHVTTPLGLAVTYAAPVITSNVIRDNTADVFGGGIALYLDDGSTIANNLIEGNTAGEGGGGIDMFSSFPSVIGNTIVNNCSTSACLQGGGGVAITNSGIVDMRWNVIARNDAAAGAGGVNAFNSQIEFTSNDVALNAPTDYAGVTDPTGSNGNLSVTPQFVDLVSGNYRLASTSPLLDLVPFTADEIVPCQDLDGLPRVMEHDGDGLAERDLGAYERFRDTVPGEVENLRFASATIMEWDATPGATSYKVYRDLLTSLSLTASPACLDTVADTMLVDNDILAVGEGFFYLTTAAEISGEGSLGFQVCRERSNFAPCP